MSVSACDLLAGKAPEFGVTILTRSGARLTATVPVPMPDGSAPSYSIVMEAAGPMVPAREEVPVRLPAFCPERHINADGSFCLGWEKVDPLAVNDESDAWSWWARLIKFLRLQERAARRRCWPDSRAWAHGAAAAQQLRAEHAAARLGEPFVDDIARNLLTVARLGTSSNGPALRVYRDGVRIFSVWELAKRPVNLRRRCLCKKGETRRPAVLRNCGTHKQDAVDLAFSLRDRAREEAKFWKTLEGRVCCGTMDGCPLAIGGS
ncbi:E2 domain-associated cysteine-rich protein [Hyphomicrobium sp.]|uniref:E2 domain-associated cysteine-rich protein n=1 Tax=Hyphomicrobium sp. TaxID=82 RepID=UPI00345068BC